MAREIKRPPWSMLTCAAIPPDLDNMDRQNFALKLILLLVLGGVLTIPLLAQDEHTVRTIHVFVALADNQNQGIVPVPAKLGNGEDPERNLYWGSAFGVKTFFKRSAEWELVASGQKPKAEILERCVFKHRTRNVYLIADAYRGIQIRQAIVDFLGAAAGSNPEKIRVKAGLKDVGLPVGGGANLIAYVGHDGLMDFQLSTLPQKA